MIPKIYKKIEEYSPNKEHKVFIAFDYMIVDMLSNKRFEPIVTELIIRGKKLNTFLV